MAQATSAQAQGKKLVVIFQRGAADGLNVVVPYREPSYYEYRPNIGIPQSAVIDLDGFFGLHPAMAPLKPLWDQGHLAIVHASGSPDPSRSHFDAQDFMESGTPGMKVHAGWVAESRAAGGGSGLSGLRAYAVSGGGSGRGGAADAGGADPGGGARQY